MNNILIIYSSIDGQTKKICEKIKHSSSYYYSAKIVPLDHINTENISNFNKIIIGASIRYGKHSKKLYDFVKLNKSILKNKKTGFFSVNVVARKSNKNTPDTNPYIKKFLKLTEWEPNKLAVFAGKIDYPKYNFFDKNVIRLIMYITKGPTDINQTFEFTNWTDVSQFAKEIQEI